jgi:hypothetical protein
MPPYKLYPGRNRKLPVFNRLSVPHRHSDQNRPNGQHNQLGLRGLLMQNGSERTGQYVATCSGLGRATNIVTVDIILIVISLRNFKKNIFFRDSLSKVVEVLK